MFNFLRKKLYEKLFHNIEKIEKYMFDNLKFKLC